MKRVLRGKSDPWARTTLHLIELTQVSVEITEARDVRQAVDIVGGFLLHSLNLSWVFVGLVDRIRNALVGALFSGAEGEPLRIAIEFDDRSSALIESLSGGVPVTGEGAVRLLGAQGEEAEGVGPFVTFPIPRGLGIVAVDPGERSPTSEDEALSFDLFLGQLGVAIENAVLYRRLRREQQFRASVTNSMGSGLITVGRNARVTSLNTRAAELLGVEIEAALDRPIKEIWKPQRPQVDPLQLSLAKGKAQSHKDLHVERPDGSMVVLQVKTSLLRGEYGPHAGLVAELTDASSTRKTDEEIFQLEKLAAIGRLTTSVAHEIRNPLAGIMTGVQYLAKKIDEGDPQRETIHFIINEIMRLDRIIVDLYSASRPMTLWKEEIDAAEIVERSIRSVQDLCERYGIEASVRIAGLLPPVCADADKIQQVLINLIKNAIEISDRGGRVEIDLRAVNRFATSVDSKSGDSSHLLIAISDRGPGIPDEDQDRLFEPFYSTKEGGTGLGLYVSHSIVERHGGDLRVESEVGEGTTITLELPLGAAASEESL